MTAELENAVDFGHHIHRVGEQVFDQFAAEHRIERFIGVGINVVLGIEEVDVAFEGFAVFGDHRLMVDPSSLPK